MMNKCIICGQRPARTGSPYCNNCGQKLETAKASTGSEQPVKYMTYRGQVLGFYRVGGNKLRPRLLQRKPDNLPKSKTIDLNVFVHGFDRDQIKAFKATFQQLSAVG